MSRFIAWLSGSSGGGENNYNGPTNTVLDSDDDDEEADELHFPGDNSFQRDGDSDIIDENEDNFYANHMDDDKEEDDIIVTENNEGVDDDDGLEITAAEIDIPQEYCDSDDSTTPEHDEKEEGSHSSTDENLEEENMLLQRADDGETAVEEIQTNSNEVLETQSSTEEDDNYNDEQIIDSLKVEASTESKVLEDPPSSSSKATTVKATLINDQDENGDDSFPKAREFLSETINDDQATTTANDTSPNRDDDITTYSISRTRKAADIVEGFNDDEYNNDYNNNGDDSRTVVTTRTSISRVQPVSAAFKSATQEVAKKKSVHPHQSIFDILEKNFEELGEGGGGGGGSRFGKKIAYQDVKLCFVAFVAVFSLPQEPVFANPVYSEIDTVNVSSNEPNNDVDEQFKSINGEEQQLNGRSSDGNAELESRKKSTTRPSVPLSVAFALWNKVLQQSHGNGSDFSDDSLSYIRSTLVLLGLLELKSIERDRDDDVAPPSLSNRLMGYSHSLNRSIECLSVHDEIHQQYGEYLAWGDQDGTFKLFVQEQEQRWNAAVMDVSNQIGYNQYTLRMLPLNTMRANYMQDAFDLLKDKTFVRRRMRGLGASEAAKAHVGDVDEVLSLIEKRIANGGVVGEPIDEQEALLSAYLQLKKYCLHEADELTKHYKDEDGNIKLGKAIIPKMSDLGDAIHLMGASLGGYGFYDDEMEYYEEALRLKSLAVNGNWMKSVTAAETLHCMGFSLDNVGRSDDAIECYEQALEIRLECLGDNDLRVADTYHNKGALLCEEDQPDEAMECLEEALRIRELHYGEEHVSCADTMVRFYRRMERVIFIPLILSNSCLGSV